MEVFIPHLKDRNIYLDEIINYSDCDFIFGDFNAYKKEYKIVNIHFPEAIFDWKVPTHEQLNDLEEKIIMWKTTSKIVYTLNDSESHYSEKNKFSDLFKLIHKYADGVIHLGNYSLKTYKNLFSENCKHTVIYHPLYESLLNDFKSSSFEEKFKLDLSNKYVVSVIGEIRSMEEIQFIFKAFKNIPVTNKFLIVPNMLHFTKLPVFFPYRLRKLYRKWKEFFFCYPLRRNQYFFNFKFIEYNYMVDLVKQSDIMIIPRIKSLNSGNIYLGISFDKLMLIPKVGNQTEIADFFNFPLLDLKNNNFKEIINSLLQLNDNRFFKNKDYLQKKENFRPFVIAAKYDDFFNNMIN